MLHPMIRSEIADIRFADLGRDSGFRATRGHRLVAAALVLAFAACGAVPAALAGEAKNQAPFTRSIGHTHAKHAKPFTLLVK
jgi:hypothetical protein